MTRGEAFKQARKAGLKEFTYEGKRYNTKLASDKPKSDFVSHVGEAIKVAENDPTGRFGIRSETFKSVKDDQKTLDNSVRNNRKRWEKAGKPGKFVDFMGKRWAPIGAKNDPKNLNKNWPNNVRGALKKRLSTEEYKKWKAENLVKLSPTAEAIRRKV